MNKTRTQCAVAVLKLVSQDSSECSLQLYPSSSISDFWLFEKLERALIDTPAVWYEGEKDHRQNDEKFTYLATKKLTVIYWQPTKVENFKR